MHRLLEHLSRGGQYGYYWLKDPQRKTKRTVWYPVGKIPAIKQGDKDLYYGVHPTKCIPQRTDKDGKELPPSAVRAKLEDIAAVNCLFSEYDSKDYSGSKEAAYQHIQSLSTPPSMIIDSGGGYHCYWLLTQPVMVTDPDTLVMLQRIQARWVAAMGGDLGAKDLCRVLRVPGTVNYKYTPAASVAVIHDSDQLYQFLDLIQVLPPDEDHQDPQPQPGAPAGVDRSPDTWLTKALQRRVPGTSNATGYWLACQLRDDGTSVSEAEGIMIDYASAVRSAGSKSGYTDKEALQTLHSAYNGHARPKAYEAQHSTPKYSGNGYHPPVDDKPDPEEKHQQDQQRWLPYTYVLQALDEGEDGDAKLTAKLFTGKLLYDHSDGAWYMWKKHFWERDKTRIVYRVFSRRVAPQYLHAAAYAQEGGREDLSKKLAARATALCNKKRMDNVLFLAASQPGVGISGDEWDSDPWLLGCGNGVVDLRTGQLRPGKPDDYIRAHTEVDYIPGTPADTWHKFLADVFGNDSELIGFVRRLLGYSITGLTREHVFPILWGDGRNGKSTLLETLADVLGNDIATSSQADALMDATRGGDGPKPFIWSLRGKRLVWASESNEGRRINEGLVKQLTGGDRLNVRTLHSKPIEFKPTHTLLLLTNHRPHINADGSAIWERVHLIPFTQRFIDHPKLDNEHQRDPHIREKLLKELAGILAWLVRGCLEWQEIGLSAPETITAATAEYREDEDTTGMFIADRCILRDGISVKASELYQAYAGWCKESGIQPMSITAFGKWIKKKPVNTRRSNTGIIYDGIGLLATVVKLPLV